MIEKIPFNLMFVLSIHIASINATTMVIRVPRTAETTELITAVEKTAEFSSKAKGNLGSDY